MVAGYGPLTFVCLFGLTFRVFCVCLFSSFFFLVLVANIHKSVCLACLDESQVLISPGPYSLPAKVGWCWLVAVPLHGSYTLTMQ